MTQSKDIETVLKKKKKKKKQGPTICCLQETHLIETMA
jgi:hypothetical protein